MISVSTGGNVLLHLARSFLCKVKLAVDMIIVSTGGNVLVHLARSFPCKVKIGC